MRQCRESGLAIDSTRGLHYNPLTQRYWLDANVDVNYMVACRKPA